MTNDPLDPDEAPLWERGAEPDPQFHPVLRLDRILNKWDQHWQVLQSKGYRRCRRWLGQDHHRSPALSGIVVPSG